MIRFCRVFLVFSVLGSLGCTTQIVKDPNINARELLKNACEPGKTVESARGTVWLKASSSEVNGQFSANILATAPSQMMMEVTNFLGGTEALITIKDNWYEMKEPQKDQSKPVRRETGYGAWGGIPLRWAADLFLGKVPCPDTTKKARLQNQSGELRVEVADETSGISQLFVYEFRQHLNHPWPNALHWEQKGPKAIAVDFKFDDPEEGTFSPRKWEAKSSRGVVKSRWRDRQITQSKMLN